MKISFVQQPQIIKPKKAGGVKPTKTHEYVQEKRRRQRTSSESELFGSKLFEPIVQREREIVVTFPYKFLYDKTRISACGRFAYRYYLDKGDPCFNLFFIENPIDELNPTSDKFDILKTIEVEYQGKFTLFEHLTAKEFEDAVRKLSTITIGILRSEIRNDRDKIVQGILDDLKQEAQELRELEDVEDIHKEHLAQIVEEKVSASKPKDELEIKIIKKEDIISRRPLLFRKVTSLNE